MLISGTWEKRGLRGEFPSLRLRLMLAVAVVALTALLIGPAAANQTGSIHTSGGLAEVLPSINEFCDVFSAGRLKLKDKRTRIELDCGGKDSGGDIRAARDMVSALCAKYPGGELELREKHIHIETPCGRWESEGEAKFTAVMNMVDRLCSAEAVVEFGLGTDSLRIEARCVSIAERSGKNEEVPDNGAG